MKKILFTLALASTFTFTCTDTRAPIPIQNKVLVESKNIIDTSIKKGQEIEKDTSIIDEFPSKTLEYWLEEEMNRENYVGAGDIILTILERRVNEQYSIAVLINLFFDIIRILEQENKLRERDFLMNEYNKFLQTNF
ncbi:hypothetical protein KO317_03140 [Candidatus Micrarchaeota archaeon]|nr:hypothetical protein [Candidatus Micrarchaeota archaeon]